MHKTVWWWWWFLGACIWAGIAGAFALGAHAIAENTFAVVAGGLAPVDAMLLRSIALHVAELGALVAGAVAAFHGVAWLACELSRRGIEQGIKKALADDLLSFKKAGEGVHLAARRD